MLIRGVSKLLTEPHEFQLRAYALRGLNNWKQLVWQGRSRYWLALKPFCSSRKQMYRPGPIVSSDEFKSQHQNQVRWWAWLLQSSACPAKNHAMSTSDFQSHRSLRI